MALQTAPAVHPPLLDQVTEETLRRNVTKVLETLAENRYQDSPPARLVAVTKTVSPRVINLLKPMGILDVGENRARSPCPSWRKSRRNFIYIGSEGCKPTKLNI